MGSFSDKNCTIVVTKRGQRLVWWSARGISFLGWETLWVMPVEQFWAIYTWGKCWLERTGCTSQINLQVE